MQKLTRGLVPLIGIALILAGVYLIFKPKIDAYLTNKENEQKLKYMKKVNKMHHQKCLKFRKTRRKSLVY